MTLKLGWMLDKRFITEISSRFRLMCLDVETELCGTVGVLEGMALVYLEGE